MIRSTRLLQAWHPGAWLTLAVVICALSLPTAAQPGAQRGQFISPVYEGFMKNPDGSFDLLFGYFNRNWAEEIEVPIGPNNAIEPGGPDQAQPTYFLPRRNQFVFRVRVPADFGNREVVWTLTSNGVTARAYGTLKLAYAVDETVIQANFSGATGFRSNDVVGNRAPSLKIEGKRTRTVRGSEPVTLHAVVIDDGKPGLRTLPPGGRGYLPNSATGLRLAWFLYRGPGSVNFDPPQTKVWEDRRPGANSPWAPGWKPPQIPSDNRWVVRATFGQPGTYVLRCLAHDGGLQTYEEVTVLVAP